jgi:hypothetical protein
MLDSKALGRVYVESPEGEKMLLGSLWAARPLVLGLVRQFG